MADVYALLAFISGWCFILELQMTEFDTAYGTCAREFSSEFDTPAPSKETVLANLPDWLKEEANEWGWTDTCVRDQLFEFMVEL